MMKSIHFTSVIYLIILAALSGGCASHSPDTNGRQANIGLGIVEGTKGYLQLQKEKMPPTGAMRTVQGQVYQIEGAAYVIHLNDQIDVRLPVDENTRIDRPAHVGDWIEAQIDQAGRARFIRNIDDRVTLD